MKLFAGSYKVHAPYMGESLRWFEVPYPEGAFKENVFSCVVLWTRAATNAISQAFFVKPVAIGTMWEVSCYESSEPCKHFLLSAKAFQEPGCSSVA
jgi:hypothetical protein